MPINIFPELTTEEIFARVDEHWDFSGPTPLPKKSFICPYCGYSEWQLRQVEFFTYNHSDHRIMFRCNVHLKCTGCSSTPPPWGIPITEAYWRENHGNAGDWRHVRDIWEAHETVGEIQKGEVVPY